MPASDRPAARPGAPLAERLLQAVLAEHQELIEALLRRAGAALSRSEPDTTPAQAIPRQALARRLDQDRVALTRRYAREIDRGFDAAPSRAEGGSADRELQRYVRPPTEALEEQLALNELARRLHAAAPERFDEAEAQLRARVRSGELDVATNAVAPAAAIEALRRLLETLALDLPLRRLFFGLYEPLAADTLPRAAAAALRTLAEADAPPPGAADRLSGAPDADLLAVLRAHASGHDADARLARLLADLVDAGTHLPVLQRLSLLGRLCRNWFAELPAAVRDEVEALRFTLIKTALLDPQFLLSPLHPMRALLRQACEHPDGVQRARESARLRAMAMSADFVRTSLATLPPLTSAQIDAGLDQLRLHDRKREEAQLDEVRLQVAAALDRAILLQAHPAGLRLFLREGWGPVMTQRLLRHGRESAVWQAALARLDAVLAALAEDTRVRDFEALLSQVSSDLFGAGLHSERCERLLQGLREAFYELRAGPFEAEPDASIAAARLEPAPAWLPGVGRLDLPEAESPERPEIDETAAGDGPVDRDEPEAAPGPGAEPDPGGAPSSDDLELHLPGRPRPSGGS